MRKVGQHRDEHLLPELSPRPWIQAQLRLRYVLYVRHHRRLLAAGDPVLPGAVHAVWHETFGSSDGELRVHADLVQGVCSVDRHRHRTGSDALRRIWTWLR